MMFHKEKQRCLPAEAVSKRKVGLRAMILAAGLILGCSLIPDKAVLAAPGYTQVAKSTQYKEVKSYGMTPIYGKDVPDGVYEVKVKSSSTFFRVQKAILTVEDGKMSADFIMYSSSYTVLYPGTGEEAAKAPESEYIFPNEGEEECVFTVPIESLNDSFDLAAFSKKKQKWYDRKILLLASSLPSGTFDFEFPDYQMIDKAMEEYMKANGLESEEVGWEKPKTQTAADRGGGEIESEELTPTSQNAGPAVTQERKEELATSIDMPDGDYSIEVTLAGGSGRATVSSPTWFYVRDGKAYAKLLWSSVYYDYMVVEGDVYYNETTDGSNSTFTIPVTEFDDAIEVVADTIAMGDPVEIEYELTFYQETIGDKGRIPQEAAIKVLWIAFAIIVGGGVLNHIVKKRMGL